METVPQIILIILLIGVNAFFAASEYAIIAVRSSRIDELAKKGDFIARLIQRALVKREDYIFTIQIGTTIVSLLLGWLGQPIIARAILSVIPSSLVANTISVIVALVILTFFSIVFGELLPKTITLYHPERVLYFIISPLVLLVNLLKPFVGFLYKINTVILKAFGLSERQPLHITYSKDEISIILKQFFENGRTPKYGVDMLQNVFTLSDKTIKSVMTPRPEIVALEINATLSSVLKRVDESFSRYPVYKKSLDNIVGFIHTKDIYKRLALGMKENIKLSKMLVVRKALNVPETKKIDDVLLDMRKKHVHMAAVYDEFGMMVGIVTLEDIIESLVGDIQDEFDTPIKGIQRNADGSYVIDGNMSADVIQKRFHLPIKGHRYRTIGGMIFGLLGREPHVGDELEIGHLFFDVMEISGKRIKLLRLKRQAKN